ncbi:TVP38/TMEM64 family protein [Heliomicrobium modesticaldum]|uniref:TVP38/TMEM64 family protein n=1 Tax=Heliomicrobium modesticaldum TaxID=35701 RepID=UPI0002F08458|nr:VTT domain-containing protein [Heliomicrobium modesticaldum]
MNPRSIGPKGAALLTLIVVGLLLFGTEPGRRIVDLVTLTDLDELTALLRSYGWAAWLAGFLLMTVQTLIGVIPAVFLLGALVIVFGWGPGLFIGWLGEIAGSAVAFALFRYFGRGPVARWLAKDRTFSEWDEWTARHGFSSIFLIRLAPFVPSGAVNLAAAVSSVGFLPFILGTALGKIPTILLETVVGHDMWNPLENASRLALAVVALGLLAMIIKRFR